MQPRGIFSWRNFAPSFIVRREPSSAMPPGRTPPCVTSPILFTPICTACANPKAAENRSSIISTGAASSARGFAPSWRSGTWHVFAARAESSRSKTSGEIRMNRAPRAPSSGHDPPPDLERANYLAILQAALGAALHSRSARPAASRVLLHGRSHAGRDRPPPRRTRGHRVAQVDACAATFAGGRGVVARRKELERRAGARVPGLRERRVAFRFEHSFAIRARAAGDCSEPLRSGAAARKI